MSLNFKKVFRFLIIQLFRAKAGLYSVKIRQKPRFLGAFVRDIFFVNESWYAGRDSNPQPSEPESDALSIEPPAHTFFAGIIIPHKNQNARANFAEPAEIPPSGNPGFLLGPAANPLNGFIIADPILHIHHRILCRGVPNHHLGNARVDDVPAAHGAGCGLPEQFPGLSVPSA